MKPEKETPGVKPRPLERRVRQYRIRFEFDERSLESFKRLKIEVEEIKLKGGKTLFLPKQQKNPCGECHLHENETCDICGAMMPNSVLDTKDDA